MRTFLTSLVLATVVIVHSTAGAQTLDDAAVDAAIRAGQANKYGHLVSSCVAAVGFGAHMSAGMAGGLQPTGKYDVIVSTASGRIAWMAADAKRLYKPFAAEHVPDAIRAGDIVFVTAIPQSPRQSGKTYDYASPVERIVLKSKANANAVAQPTNVDLTPVEWKNLLGGTLQGTIAVATFPMSDVKELPPGEFDVVLITQAGERRCKVGKDDRLKVFGQ